MEKIWELFGKLEELLKEEMDARTYLKFYNWADYLAYSAKQLHREKQLELKSEIDFFHNADMSNQFSFGWCGDDVYWKIIERVLYIGGSGPMWDFDYYAKEGENTEVNAPWATMDYDTVVILDGVTSIGSEAFRDAHISDVVIPYTVKIIKECAFWDARVENLILPQSIERLEEFILAGYGNMVEKLTVSVNIPDIQPMAFFNRGCRLAHTIYLCGTLPSDLTDLMESLLFDEGTCDKIFYPAEWDKDGSFCERLSRELSTCESDFCQTLNSELIPYDI